MSAFRVIKTLQKIYTEEITADGNWIICSIYVICTLKLFVPKLKAIRNWTKV